MRSHLHGRLGPVIRRAAAVSAQARATGAPVDEVAEQMAAEDHHRTTRFGRRTMLGGMASFAAVAASAPPTTDIHGLNRRSDKTAPRIVIVGGGLAGIRCAHYLWTEKQVASTIYEWDDRLGGRVDTIRNAFADGEIVERCGEFISSEHHSMRQLATRFGLTLGNTDAYPRGTVDTFWLNGGRYTEAMLNADWHEFGWTLFQRTVRSAPWPTTYRTKKPSSIALDNMSAAEWIDFYVPGGLKSDFGQLCYLDVECEYGGPPEEQSALNVIYLLSYDDSVPSSIQPKKTPALGGTDEKWHVEGGNDRIVSGMLAELPRGATRINQQLVALRDNGNRTYTCTFEVDGVATDVVADHVVVTIPFNKLKEVDLRHANLSPRKMTAIDHLTLGNSVKIALQVAGNPWNADGYDGNMFAQNLTVSGWDNSVDQPAPNSIFFDYLGGKPGAALASQYGLVGSVGTAPPALIANYLKALEPLFPGFTEAWNIGPQLSLYSDPNINPHLDGAYSQYQVGQYTTFSGIEGVPEGNIHFAGEHTSQDFQGFMEGGVVTGERAAKEILNVI